MLLQVHDELVFEVPDKEIEKTKGAGQGDGERRRSRVPLVVDTGAADNWAAAHWSRLRSHRITLFSSSPRKRGSISCRSR